jgi:hypothetical protein
MAKENDIVLIYLEDNPSTFARIESIKPDHKPNWYHVTFLILQVPVQVVTWILRDVYIDGETFTMGGKEMRLELIQCPEIQDAGESDTDGPSEKPAGKKGKVISLADLKHRE